MLFQAPSRQAGRRNEIGDKVEERPDQQADGRQWIEAQIHWNAREDGQDNHGFSRHTHQFNFIKGRQPEAVAECSLRQG
jgi:hypothetical protein